MPSRGIAPTWRLRARACLANARSTPYAVTETPGRRRTPCCKGRVDALRRVANARSVDAQLAELGPVGAGEGEVHDPGGLGEVGRELALSGPEVVGLHVRGARVVVGEGLDEDVLGGVVQAARPVEPQVAGLGAGGLG